MLEEIYPVHKLLAKMFKGFGDLSRLQILHTIRDEPLKVSEIVVQTGLSQPNVSSHLRCLNDCNLVKSKKKGRSVYYSLSSQKISELLRLSSELLDDVYQEIAACINYEV